jgi:hypothetical protein
MTPAAIAERALLLRHRRALDVLRRGSAELNPVDVLAAVVWPTPEFRELSEREAARELMRELTDAAAMS